MLKLLFTKIKKAMGFATHGLLVSSISFGSTNFRKTTGGGAYVKGKEGRVPKGWAESQCRSCSMPSLSFPDHHFHLSAPPFPRG
jgi:hypothetical protein